MSDKGPRLSGMGPQFEAPSADDNHRRVHNVLRSTVKEQGQVMSATLENNALLWEERKQMKQLLKEKEGKIAQLQGALTTAREELAKLKTPEHRSLHDLRVLSEEQAKQIEGLKKALMLHLTEAIGPDELKERFVALTEQRKELDAAGVKPTELMIAQNERAAQRRAEIEASDEAPPTQPE